MTLPPAIGHPAPGFELPNQHGEPVSLDAQRGAAVALVFYPFAFSRVCTDELDKIQQHLGEFASRSAKVLALSVDHKYALRTYAEHRGYDFDLLADFWPHGEVAQRYGVLDATHGYARRSTFFINSAGALVSRVDAPLGKERSFDEYRTALRELPKPTPAL